MEINVGFALMLATLAGLSTGIGSSIAYFIRKPKYSYLAVLLGFSAGLMVYISFAELFKTAIDEVGFGMANIAFFVGIGFIAVLDLAVPHSYIAEESRIHDFKSSVDTSLASRTKLMRIGQFTALGIAIHNIPEGISVSIPIFYATGSRRKAFFYSFMSGVAEPVGALIGFAILFPFLSPFLISSLLAFVAGIMIYISLDELLPAAHKYGREHHSLAGLLAGMLVMALSLFLLR